MSPKMPKLSIKMAKNQGIHDLLQKTLKKLSDEDV